MVHSQNHKWYLPLMWVHLLTETSHVHINILGNFFTTLLSSSWWFGSFVIQYDDDDNYMHILFWEKPHEFRANCSHSCCIVTYWIWIQSRTTYKSGSSGLIWKDWIWKHWIPIVMKKKSDLCQEKKRLRQKIEFVSLQPDNVNIAYGTLVLVTINRIGQLVLFSKHLIALWLFVWTNVW